MILVDEPSAGAYYGSLVAAPYGKLFFSEFFDFFGIPKDDPNIVIEYVIMPDVTGKSLADAVSELKVLGVCYEIDGDGSFIKKQLPPVGTKICKGETILLIT